MGTEPMSIEAVIEALGCRYDADEAAIIGRMLREYHGTVPDDQLIEEAAPALAIHRGPVLGYAGRRVPV
jgi:hypothetical protein